MSEEHKMIVDFINRGRAAQAAVDQIIKPLAITRAQKKRVAELLNTAEQSLRIACEERLNLDSETRREIERAVDAVMRVWTPLQSQPVKP